MSGNSAKVREKSWKGRGITVVGEILLWQLNSLTYLYFVRTVVHFSYMMFFFRRIWINKRAFVRHIACNFVWKSRGSFSIWRVVICERCRCTWLHASHCMILCPGLSWGSSHITSIMCRLHRSPVALCGPRSCRISPLCFMASYCYYYCYYYYYYYYYCTKKYITNCIEN